MSDPEPPVLRPLQTEAIGGSREVAHRGAVFRRQGL
jgi:hypothetical protein